MNEKYTEFNELVILNSYICVTIKKMYYPDTTWFLCYRDVAKKLTEVKRKARLYLDGMTEKEVIQQLGKFSPEDLKELMDECEKETVQRK